MDKSQWSRWNKSNIVEHEFFKEGVDWVGFDIMSNGNETRDFAITIEFAKHIAMMAKTQRAHDYRNYFIECEKKAHEKTAQIEPPTKHTKPLLIIPAPPFTIEIKSPSKSAQYLLRAILSNPYEF